MEKKTTLATTARIVVCALCAVLLCAVSAIFLFAAPKRAVAEGSGAVPAIGAEVYTAQTAEGQKTKLGEYENFKLAVDAMVADNVAHTAGGDDSLFYTIEVLADCEIDNNLPANKYSQSNVPGGLFAANDQLTGILIVGDMDVTINGNEHLIVVTNTSANIMRAIRIRGESHVVINDLEVVTKAGAESKCLETRGGNINLELNRVILQVGYKGNSQALCFGGSGYMTQDGKDVVTTATCVANDCSFGTPVPGRKINGKEVKNYFDQDGDGTADDPAWPIPTAHYGIMSFVKIDLTLNNSSSGGFAAIYMKTPLSSTGARNSVVRVLNNSYMRGYNVNSGDSNNFGAIVFEECFLNETYYDYDNDGIIDGTANFSNNFTIKDKSGNDIIVWSHYDETSNITVIVDDSTVESTTIAPEVPGNQYCFMAQTGSNTVTVSGNSALITDDEFRDAPTKAFVEFPGYTNKIEVTGGRLFKWNELPEKYILSDVAVGEMLYQTLPEAIENTENGDTVSLIRSLSFDTGDAVSDAGRSAAAIVESGKSITFDLNGKTLSLYSEDAAISAVVNDGTLTVKNGTVERAYNSAPCSMIVNNGELVLSGLYVIDRTAAQNVALIANGGAGAKSGAGASLTVESGTYVSTGGNVVENGSGATATIAGGTLESRAASGSALVNDGTAAISGGTLKGNSSIVSRSKTEISGGLFKGGVVFATNAVTIKGGTFDVSVKSAIEDYIADNYHLSAIGSTVTVTQFVARSDLEYTGTEYAPGTALNALLESNSVKITDDMTVRLIKYADADGVLAETLPEKIKNAGTYTVEIKLGEEIEAVIDITIARKRVSLQDLDFSVVKIASAATSAALESMTLYSASDGTYSLVRDSSHTQAVKVVNGVVRARDAQVELGLTVGVDNNAYTFTLADATATDIGKYTTTASIVANANYELFVGDAAALARRGIEIVGNGDGEYTLSKTWYIVDMDTWLVDGTGKDYTIGAGHVFGQTPQISVPWLNKNDAIGADEAPAFDDKVHLALSYNSIIIENDFRRYQMSYYINSSMPAGEYEFIVTVEDVLTSSFGYEVYPLEVDQTSLDGFLDSLADNDGNGKKMTIEWDGYMHVFDDDTLAKYNALSRRIAEMTPERSGRWLDSAYDVYYGGLSLTFNMDRMHNAQYYDVNTLAGLADRPAAPGLYTMYYALSAKNFAPLIDLDFAAENFETMRRTYVYYVAIVRGVEIPTVSSAIYNGNVQKADIAGNEFYTVDHYDGFTDAASHDVTVRLRAPEYYYWIGHELGEDAVNIKFEITKATNDWIESPDIVRWIEGKFDEEENGFIGAAKFGNISYVITDMNDNVIYDLSQGIDNRASMKAGTYILKATVAGNDNYVGLSEAFTIRILEKVGMPWWGTLLITLGALLVAAAIILILWKKGVFQILTGKIVLAIRTRATVDATIASVRAAKKMEEGRRSVEEAKRRDAAEARRAKAREERARPEAERAAALDEKAAIAEQRAEKMRARAEVMKKRAERMREKAGISTETTVAAEAAATEDATSKKATEETPSNE